MDMKSQNIKRISSVTYPSKLIICKMFTVVRKKTNLAFKLNSLYTFRTQTTAFQSYLPCEDCRNI